MIGKHLAYNVNSHIEERLVKVTARLTDNQASRRWKLVIPLKRCKITTLLYTKDY